MATYRFRVFFEDDDAIFRDVAVLPAQPIAELCRIVALAFSLPAEGKITLYRSNDVWQKLKSIDLPETPPAAAKADKPAKETKGKTGKAKKPAEAPKAAVASSMLVSYIDDPHQHFYLEYEGKQNLSFLIELVNLGGEEKPGQEYPAVIRSEGPSPVKKEDVYQFMGAKAPKEEEVYAIDAEDDEEELEGMGSEGEEEDKDEEGEEASEEGGEYTDDFGEMDGHI